MLKSCPQASRHEPKARQTASATLIQYCSHRQVGKITADFGYGGAQSTRRTKSGSVLIRKGVQQK